MTHVIAWSQAEHITSEAGACLRFVVLRAVSIEAGRRFTSVCNCRFVATPPIHPNLTQRASQELIGASLEIQSVLGA
jgi:hypothetical protein